jgi:hypothetical protein
LNSALVTRLLDVIIIGGTLFNIIEERFKMGITDGLDEMEILEIIGEVSNGIIHLHL